MTDTKPSTSERYARAQHSSDLTLREERKGDADMLIAAGYAASRGRDGKLLPQDSREAMQRKLGGLLARLRDEYDSVRAEATKEAGNDATAVVLILMRLKSLPDAKDMLWHHASAAARVKALTLPDHQLRGLTARAMQAWLHPQCIPCTGLGSTGGYGAPRVICSTCGGSGRRDARLGESDAERLFVADLIDTMGRLAGEFSAALRRFNHG